MTSELETNIVAVERTKEYAETPTEAPPIVESHRPPPEWPNQGHVQFDHYSTRYRQGLDLVLKDISADFAGGTKVPLYTAIHCVMVTLYTYIILYVCYMYCTYLSRVHHFESL